MHDARAVREDSVCAGFARIKSGRRVRQSGAFRPITRDVVRPGEGTITIKLLDKHSVNDVGIGNSVWIAACVEEADKLAAERKAVQSLECCVGAFVLGVRGAAHNHHYRSCNRHSFPKSR